jgi:hypothetical protein
MQAVFTHNISEIDEEPRNRPAPGEKGGAPHKKSLLRYIQWFNIISLIPFVPLLSLLNYHCYHYTYYHAGLYDICI